MIEYDIGKSIKTLRKKLDITQERLANCIGVSTQAVSKWETSLSLPDIALLPRIAAFFDVTIDEVMGYKKDNIENERKIAEITIKANKYLSGGELETAEKILCNALEEFPGDHVLSCCLGSTYYIMLLTGKYTNKAKIIEKGIDIVTNVINESKNESLKMEAIKLLAQFQKFQGNIPLAEKTAELIVNPSEKFIFLGSLNLIHNNKISAKHYQKALAWTVWDFFQECVQISKAFIFEQNEAGIRKYICLCLDFLNCVYKKQTNFSCLMYSCCYYMLGCAKIIEGEKCKSDWIIDTLELLKKATSYALEGKQDKVTFYDDFYFDAIEKEKSFLPIDCLGQLIMILTILNGHEFENYKELPEYKQLIIDINMAL